MKRRSALGIICISVLLTGIVACGTTEGPDMFTDKDWDHLPSLGELIEEPNAPEEVEAIARKVNGFLPNNAKESALWKHYTITDTVSLYPVQIVRIFDSHYRAWGWGNGLEEVEMPEEARTDGWMLWYKPGNEVISVTLLIIVPEEVEKKTGEESKKELDSGVDRTPAEHVIVGRWALPKQD